MRKEVNMQPRQVSQDDVLDVAEKSEKIEKAIHDILQDVDIDLAVSALISSSINCLIKQCHNMNQLIFYKHCFFKSFDETIQQIVGKIKND